MAASGDDVAAAEATVGEEEEEEELGMPGLEATVGQLNDVLNSISLMSWDSSVMMPDSSAAAAARGQQVATLSQVARSMLLSPDTADALKKAAAELAESEDEDARYTVDKVTAALDFHNRIPAHISADRAMIKAAATQAWAKAREQSDFSLFAPHLEKTVAINR
eukprot:COSAG06_NODE_1950_length_7997_cov_37.784882_5_plen_164_part_00